MGLNSLAENYAARHRLAVHRPLSFRLSQSMTVETPPSGIESLLPPSGTSYKSLALPAYAHHRGYTTQTVPLTSRQSRNQALRIETSCKVY